MILFATRNKETDPMYGIAGGSQAAGGYFLSPNWTYSPGSFRDLLAEAFAGSHDPIGGQIPGFYDEEGNTTRGRSDLVAKLIDAWAIAAILPSAPFALAELLSPGLIQKLFER